MPKIEKERAIKTGFEEFLSFLFKNLRRVQPFGLLVLCSAGT
jgi:hypothetical protein